MELRRAICEELRIPWSYVNVAPDEDKATCLVHESWVQRLLSAMQLPAEFTRHDTFGDLECELLLQHRQARTRAPWMIIEIKVIAKTDHLVCSLPNFKKPDKSVQHDLTYSQLLHYISETNYRNLWKDAYKRYVSSYCCKKTVIQDKTHHFHNVIREALLRLYACPIIPLQSKDGAGHALSKDIDLTSLKGTACHQNVLPAYCILESADHFHVVQPHVEHTLYDCLTFSPAIMRNSNMKPLFVVYQLLELVRDLHDRGLCLGDVNLRDVGLDSNLWIRVRPKVWQGVTASAATAHRQAVRCQVSEPGVEGGGATAADRGTTPSPDACPLTFGLAAPPTFLADACRRLRRHSLDALTERWTRHEISNFDYLLVLNRLAGRQAANPNHHPVLPWVMDFTVPNGGWRDLTKSKFRLNKGDRQLDLTYEMLPTMVAETTLGSGTAAAATAVPHHVTDVLSEITYYVYRARQTPRSVLCRYVRPNWVPAEYPSSMQRLFEWTPDECIPEFFCDHTIFSSIHDDLPDLEVPWWASSPADFVARHRQALESSHVSERLHHWIDLTFGFKLSGPAAVKARNVCLHLVDKHTSLACDGVVQLFGEPHPHRLGSPHLAGLQPPVTHLAQQSRSRRERPRSSEEAILEQGGRELSDVDAEFRAKLNEKRRANAGRSRLTSLNDPNKGEQRLESQTIILPKDFSSLTRLNQLETLYNFTSKTTYKAPLPKHSVVSEVHHSFSRQRTRDMIVVGCIIAEIFLANKLCALDSKATLEQRYQLIYAFLKSDLNELPRCVRSSVKLLLHVDRSRSVVGGRWELPSRMPSVTSGGLPPPSAHQLLQPLVQVLPFPPYFQLTFDFICRMRHYSEKIAWAQLMRGGSAAGGEERTAAAEDGWERLAETKVKMTAAALPELLPQLNEEGLALLTPYLRALFDDPDTALMAAWYLLNVVGRALGPCNTARCLVEPLVRLLNAERTTAKHMKLFHRSYLLQLIVRLGLSTFLAHFTNILIEAVGGFKDFGTGETECRKASHRRSPDLESMIQDSEQKDAEETLDETLSPFDENLSQTEIASPWTKSDSENVDFSRTEQDTLTEPEIFVFEAAGDDFDNGDARRNEVDADLLDQLGQKFGENSSGSTSDDAVSISHSPTAADDEHLHSYGGDNGGVDIIKADGQPPLSTTNPSSFSEGFPMPRATTRLCSLEPTYSASVPNLTSEFLAHPQPAATADLAADTPSDDNGAGPASASEQVRSSHRVAAAYNVADVAMESVVWLTHRLGPVLTAKHLARNLLKMTSLCYIRDDYLEYVTPPGDNDGTSTESAITISPRKVVGDKGSQRVFECLSIIASLYGEQFILLQYFPHMVEIVSQSKKRITSGCEAGLVGSLSLIHYIVPYLSDATLMDNLQDALIKDILYPIVRLISSQRLLFPTGGHARQVIAFKLLDALYLIGLRIGFEMTRKHLTAILRRFFATFSRVHTYPAANVVAPSSEKHSKELSRGVDICDSSNSSPSSGVAAFQSQHGRFKASCDSMSPPIGEKDGQSIETLAKEELSQAFTCELAYHAYISFCKLAGSIHLGRSLGNEELIQQLCHQYDRGLDTRKPVLSDETIPSQILSLSLQPAGVALKAKEPVSDDRQNVAVIGNRIDIRLEEEDEDSVCDGVPLAPTALAAGDRAAKLTDYPKCDISKLISKQMDNEFRHLKGNWFAYWEHEIGRSDKDYRFNFKQIKLQTFVGHVGGIRTIRVLDNENSFISASKDKTVKLWSLRSHGDGLSHSPCQWTYSNHKKSVFSVIFLESLRLAASCDSTVHIWDPFMGSCIKVFDSAKNPPVTVLTAMPAPSALMVTATTEATIRFMDARVLRYMHEYKVSLGPAGLIRCLAVSPNGLWIGVGHSSGIISILDVRTGMMSSCWKGHEGEILQIKAFNNNTFVTTSVDQSVSVWNADDGKLKCHLRGPTEPVHCFSFYRNEMISGTTANRICVHTSVDSQASFSSTRLRSDTFKGMLTSLTVLPLNRLLLLGGEKGTIKLLC